MLIYLQVAKTVFIMKLYFSIFICAYFICNSYFVCSLQSKEVAKIVATRVQHVIDRKVTK